MLNLLKNYDLIIFLSKMSRLKNIMNILVSSITYPTDPINHPQNKYPRTVVSGVNSVNEFKLGNKTFEFN